MDKFLILFAIFGVSMHLTPELSAPSVDGIKLNDTLQSVQLALGQPLSQETTYNECDPNSHNIRWYYPGMNITFTQQDDKIVVNQIMIDNGDWSLNGIHIDDSVKRVKNAFGDVDFIHDVLPYQGRNDTSWEFTIRHQQVANMTLRHSHCRVA